MSANLSLIDLLKRKYGEDQREPPPAPSPQLPRDWWSARGTGWGPNHDKPNPFAELLTRLQTDATETVADVRDELGEVPYRLKRRLDDYIKGRY
jgi:hypothetical protein